MEIVRRVTKTDDLIKEGYLSKFRIKVLLCKHAPQHFDTYHDEMEYLVEHKGRNNLIKNLVKDIDGNTLVLFNYIEKHGEPLYELINNSIDPERKLFFVHGGTDVEDGKKSVRLQRQKTMLSSLHLTERFLQASTLNDCTTLYLHLLASHAYATYNLSVVC